MNFKLECTEECLREIRNSKAVISDGNRFFYKGAWIGTLDNGVGPYGKSSGIFLWCQTTEPLTEMFDGWVNGKHYPPYC